MNQRDKIYINVNKMRQALLSGKANPTTYRNEYFELVGIIRRARSLYSSDKRNLSDDLFSALRSFDESRKPVKLIINQAAAEIYSRPVTGHLRAV